MLTAMLLKPFVGLVLFCLAFVVAHYVLKLLPDSRFKRLLTRPVGRAGTNRSRRGPP